MPADSLMLSPVLSTVHLALALCLATAPHVRLHANTRSVLLSNRLRKRAFQLTVRIGHARQTRVKRNAAGSTCDRASCEAERHASWLTAARAMFRNRSEPGDHVPSPLY